MRKISNRDAVDYIRRLARFESHTGNFWGCAHTPGRYIYTGYLPRAYATRGKIEEADYIVFSYMTPIAWHLPDGWVVPEVTYSSTTSSRHQPVARQAVDQYSEYHLKSPRALGLGPTASGILKAIRAGYNVTVTRYRKSTVQSVLDTGEAVRIDDNTIGPKED